MKKKLLIFTLTVAMLFSMLGINAGAASVLTLDASLNYAEDSVSLEISGNTSARYGQLISIVVYETDAPDNVLTQQPAKDYPLANVMKIVRMDEIAAEYNGDFELTMTFDDVDDAKYFVISAVGGGYAYDGASDSKLIYFEKQETIDNATLPAFKTVDEEGFDELIRNKQLLLGFYCDSEYEEDKDEIATLFVGIRNEDYPENFKSINDVQTTLKAVGVLQEVRLNPEAGDMKILAEENAEFIGFDFEDADYTENDDEIYALVNSLLTEEKYLPTSMSDTKTILTQATGMINLNKLDATKMTAVVEKYADAFGIDKDAYAEACEEYGADNVNMAFVERNFAKPEEVAKAYSERVEILEEENKKPSGGGSSGGSSGGGGGSFGGGSLGGGKRAEIDNDIVDTKEEEIVKPEKFSYTDMADDHWAYEAVNALSNEGVINGFEDGSFAPDKEVTREQFVKMLAEAFDIEAVSNENNFTDVEEGRWSESYIIAASSNGIVSGIGDGKFAPQSVVTRQDAAVMLKRICDKYGISLDGSAKAFADANEISTYATESVALLSGAGVIAGFEDGSFRPTNALTRAQAAKIIYGLIK